MSSGRTKSFTVSNPLDIDKIDFWWTSLLRNGPKEIEEVEWLSQGDLVWKLRLKWKPVSGTNLEMKVCMPAYSHLPLEGLGEVLEALNEERRSVARNLFIFSKKIEDWEVTERISSELGIDTPSEDDFFVNPTLSYGVKLDTAEKIMVSEFLWPNYKNLMRILAMFEARIAEVEKEIQMRQDSNYSVVRIDRGMLRDTFIEHVGYDNKWIFASDEELEEGFGGFENYDEGDSDL